MNVEVNDIDAIKGLSSSEVAAQHRKYGYNELPAREKKNLLQLAISILSEPMIILLLITVSIYYIIGDTGEAFLLSLSIGGIIGIGIYQESKTEKSLESLRKMASPICDVVRDGVRMVIPGREVVIGDIIFLSEGSRVPADAKIINATEFRVDESLLTGESAPVQKHGEQKQHKASLVFSGTMVVSGHAVATVTHIGRQTEIGKIGSSLKSIDIEKTLLQKEVNKVVKTIAIMAVAASLGLTLIFFIMRGDFLQGLLAGMTLAIAILPEEFPVVLIIFLTLGAWRLAKHHVLARRAHTIETLGSASVLCVDKTGTLTENRMTIMSVVDSDHNIFNEKHIKYQKEIIKYGVLASQKNPYDPMEEAFITLGQRSYGSAKKIYDDMQILKEYPFSANNLSVVHAWGNRSVKEIGLKGAPETVINLCHLTQTEKKKVEKDVTMLAKQGLRVIAVGRGKVEGDLPQIRQSIDYEYLGLVGLMDPIRKGVKSSIATCRKAGVKVIMITGDYPETALNIASQIGLGDGSIMIGSEFEKMSDSERKKALKTVSVFSRVSPNNKLTIVNALKKSGEIVAMTGDGVNDAPALKSAHVGISMGKRGTDVAREASSIVLMDDNFISIVKGVRLGRRIYDNLQKAMSYIISVHIPIVVLSLLPAILKWPLVLFPAHIVFLEFIIDPSCTVIFENEKESKDIMNRPPRKLTAPIFNTRMVTASVLQGLFVASVVFGVYYLLLQFGWNEDKARGMTFLTLVIANVFLIVGLSGRRAVADIIGHENKAMLMILLATIAAITLVFLIPVLRDLFHFAPLSMVELAIGALMGALTIIGVIPIKYITRKLF